MNQFLIKAGAFTALSVFIASSYSTPTVEANLTNEALDTRLVFAKPHEGVLAMQEQVGQAEIEALTAKANGDEEELKKILGVVLEDENKDTNTKVGLSTLPVPDHITEEKKVTTSSLSQINAFNDFYYGLSKSCKSSPQAKRVTDVIRKRDAIHGFYAMAFGDPNGQNRYASHQSYGGWGDIHFSGPDGNEDYHGNGTDPIVLITSNDAQVNATTAKWHGSPATIATGYYAQIKGSDGALYRVSMPMNQSVSVTKNGVPVTLSGGRNILTKNFAIDMNAKNCTLFTSRFSFTNMDAGSYKNFSLAITGPACKKNNCLGGFVGRKAARGLTGSPKGFRDGVNAFSSAFNVNDKWAAADSFKHAIFPVQDVAGGAPILGLVAGQTYLPTAEAVAGGLYTKPNGKPAFSPSQICGTTATPKIQDNVKPVQQGPDTPVLKGAPIHDAIAH